MRECIIDQWQQDKKLFKCYSFSSTVQLPPVSQRDLIPFLKGNDLVINQVSVSSVTKWDNV